MAAEGPNGTAPEAAAEPPALVITWPGVGLAGATVTPSGGVQVAQLMEAAFLLDCMARETRSAALNRAAMGQLVGAPAGILDELRRTGRV